MRILPFDDVTVAREAAAAQGEIVMNAPQSRMSALRHWPVTTRDRLPMALWDATVSRRCDGRHGKRQFSGIRR